MHCCIGPLCSYLDNEDRYGAEVGLNGIEKILKLGEEKKVNNG